MRKRKQIQVKLEDSSSAVTTLWRDRNVIRAMLILLILIQFKLSN